jgi:hypothetical protein
MILGDPALTAVQVPHGQSRLTMEIHLLGMVVTGPPSGLVSVGGYRFPLHDLREVARRVEAVATLAALCGQRRVGSTVDPDTMQAALTRSGSIRSRWPPSATAAIEA